MSKGKAQDVFRAKAPGIMAQLMEDFPLQLDDVAAVVGNFGHECAGFTAMQEINPVVEGSRGGYGWPMWTGARRRAYEAYCKRNKLDPASDKANYAYVFVELKGPEKRAIGALLKAKPSPTRSRPSNLPMSAPARSTMPAATSGRQSRSRPGTRPGGSPPASLRRPRRLPAPTMPVDTAPAAPQAPRAPSPTVALPGKVDDAPKNNRAGKVLAAIVVLGLAAAASALGLSK